MRRGIGPERVERGRLAGKMPAKNLVERQRHEATRTEGAVQRMPGASLDEIRPAQEKTGLRTAEKLVAARTDQVGAGGEQLRDGLMVGGETRRHAS